MPQNKFARKRYNIIDECLRSRSYPSKKKLAQRCAEKMDKSISESAIEKDIWAMVNESALGFYAPIEFSHVYKGYYYTDPTYSIEKINLENSDKDVIRIAVASLNQYKNSPLFRPFRDAIVKISKRVALLEHAEDAEFREYIQFETKNPSKGVEMMEDLFKAIKDKLVITYEYENIYKEEIKKYKGEPYLLKEYHNRWYLVCWMPAHNDYRTFGLDRMENLAVTKDIFTRRKDFLSRAFFQNSIGITESDEKPVKVILSFSPMIGKLVKSSPLHHSQQTIADTKKEFRISLSVLLTAELRQLVLGYGSNVKVIGPKEFVADIKKAIGEAMGNY